jgi:hypothetical protein
MSTSDAEAKPTPDAKPVRSVSLSRVSHAEFREEKSRQEREREAMVQCEPVVIGCQEHCVELVADDVLVGDLLQDETFDTVRHALRGRR